jgi:hypothetical protein
MCARVCTDFYAYWSKPSFIPKTKLWEREEYWKTESKVPLSPAYPTEQKSSCFLFKPKQGLQMKHMLLKSDNILLVLTSAAA